MCEDCPLKNMVVPCIAQKRDHEYYCTKYSKSRPDFVIARSIQEYKKETPEPSLLDKFSHAIKAAQELGKAVIRGDKINVSESEYNERLKVCESCLFNVNGICTHKDCGCVLAIKAHLNTQHCPIKLWAGDEQKSPVIFVKDCGCGQKGISSSS